jgi:hypothetical protein
MERPIIFSSGMVRTILAGNKSMTRRVMKPQPHIEYDISKTFNGKEPAFDWKQTEYKLSDIQKLAAWAICPYGKIKDYLYVKETFTDNCSLEGLPKLVYAADMQRMCSEQGKVGYFKTFKWKSPLFMPRKYSRILLEITDIQVRQVQDITEEDAKAEGVEPLFTKDIAESKPEFNLNPMPYKNYLWHGEHIKPKKIMNSWYHQYSSYEKARDSFSSLWESINAKKGYGWEKNPWVFVIQFKRII